MATKLEQEGRKGDKIVAHLTPGEIVIPRSFAEDDDFRGVLAEFMRENGANPEEFIVGSGKNKINPKTGYAEFFFHKKIKKEFKRFRRRIKREKRRMERKVEGFFKPPEIEAPVAPPPLPPLPMVDEEVSDITRRRARRRRGRAKTFLTGDLIPQTQKKTVLG